MEQYITSCKSSFYRELLEFCKKNYIYILSFFVFNLITIIDVQAQDTLRINMSTVTANQEISASETRPVLIYGTANNRVVTIKSGFKGTVVLRNLNITSSLTSSTNGASGVSCITVEGKNGLSNLDLENMTVVDIILDGTTNLHYTASNSGCAFQVNQGAQIHINSIDRNDNTKGVLNAKNATPTGAFTTEGSAAIGAPYFTSGHATGQGNAKQMTCTSGTSNRTKTAGGNIIIGSGTVTALASRHGAGIGGGWYTYYNGFIIVYGGNVTAQSNYHAAGIGSGCPQGTGVLQCFAENSTIIALPPATISAKGTTGSNSTPLSTYGLNGAKNIIYINDPDKTKVTVRTEDNEPNADLYLDLTQTDGLEDIFAALGITTEMCDLKKVRIGRTDAVGLFQFNAELKAKTTFFTDASSSQPTTSGRPYLPVETTIVAPTSGTIPPREVILPLLDTEISFTDYPSTPLEVGYSVEEARQNAFMVKLEFKDPAEMEEVTFELQGGTDPFGNMIFLAEDGVTVVSKPNKLKSGDVYYIALPINQGKPVGVYSDILLINGKWKGIPLPGYIRRVGMQRVVTDDTGKNNHVKVTASPSSFVEVHPASKTVNLTLKIDHTGTNLTYDPLDVTAKYIITTKANYEDAVAETPVNNWTNLNVPAGNLQDQITTVSFNTLPVGTYYIHWYVVSGEIYAHSEDVVNPAKTYGGFGSYVIYNKIGVGEIKGNPFVCKGNAPQEIKGEASTGGSGDFTYQWQTSTDGTWPGNVVGGNTQNYSPAAISVNTYYRRATIDNVNSVTEYSNVLLIKVVEPGLTLYWNKNAADNDWNNPANWMDDKGNPLNIIPLGCTNVYMTAGAQRYPSLNPNLTDIDIYGLPVCQNITFAYGSELMYQHRLTYEKAYVQYNFGYYYSSSGGTLRSFDEYNSPNMLKRDMWYALAAPLKKMASGDFALAGYPFTWQAKHETDKMSNGIGIVNANSFDTNDVDLNKAYNAIALKVAAFNPSKTGYKEQKNLEGLQGLIEIPYFENEKINQYRPGHSYNPIAGKSTFLYYNTNTLQTVYSPVGEMKRGDEAYRFVYEKEDGSVPTIDKWSVPGYTLEVTSSGSDKKVLIGNPVLSKISAMKFYQANQDAIEPADGYLVYDETTKAWKTLSYDSYTNSIKSFESFIVTLKKPNAKLYFPMEGSYALTDPALAPTRSTISPANSLTVTAKDLDGNGEEAYLASQYSNATRSVEKVVSSSEEAAPEVFFVDNNSYNLLQLYNAESTEIGIGVKTSQTGVQVSLSFDNVKDFISDNNISNILLVDKATGKTQDLTQNSTYNFVHTGNLMEGQYVDTDRITLKFGTGIDTNQQGANIYYSNNAISIEGIDVNNVTVFDIAGNKILELGKSDINYVPLSQGVYIVKVYGTDGIQKTARIVVK